MVLLLMPIAVAISFPYWHQIIHPEFYSGVRCIQQQEGGELVKVSGNDCKHESSTVLKLEHQP